MISKDYFKCLEFCTNAKSMIDMGAGPCLYSIEADKLGLKVTAVDGRTDRIPQNIGSIKVIIADVVKVTPDHDIVLLSGIFYHLDLGQQFELLSNINNSKAQYIILNTHYLIRNIHGIPINPNVSKFSPIFKSGSIEGVNYLEGDIDSLNNRPLASLYNKYSFWHTIESLINIVEKSTNMKLKMIFDPFVVDRRFLLFEKK